VTVSERGALEGPPPTSQAGTLAFGFAQVLEPLMQRAMALLEADLVSVSQDSDSDYLSFQDGRKHLSLAGTEA